MKTQREIGTEAESIRNWNILKVLKYRPSHNLTWKSGPFSWIYPFMVDLSIAEDLTTSGGFAQSTGHPIRPHPECPGSCDQGFGVRALWDTYRAWEFWIHHSIPAVASSISSNLLRYIYKFQVSVLSLVWPQITHLTNLQVMNLDARHRTWGLFHEGPGKHETQHHLDWTTSIHKTHILSLK